MKTYLITGGCGFIGSAFIKYMLSKHSNIRIVNLNKPKHNVGANCEHTNLELAERIVEWVGARLKDSSINKSLITFVADRPGHDRRYAIDSSKLQRELGWTKPKDFDNKFEATFEAYHLQN